MNFKNIKKFLKKNYKKIIIICLIILLFSNKMYENFSTTDALNAVASTEKKVNDIFYSIDKDWARSKKGLYSTYEVRGKTVRSMEDVISKRNITATGNVNAKKDVNADGNVKGKNLCIGKTCLNEDHLKMITDGFKLKITDNGSSSTKGKNQYIHNHGGTRLGPHSRYPTKLKMYKY